MSSFTIVILLALLLPPWSGVSAAEAVQPSSASVQAPPEVDSEQLGSLRGENPAWPNLGWTSRTDLTGSRWGHGAVSFSTGIYPGHNSFVLVISGNDESENTVNRVSRYDVASASWADVAPIPTAVHQISAVRVANSVFVPGGYATPFSPTAALQIYNVDSDTWTTGAAMPQAVGDSAVGVYLNRYIYVVGGYTGSADTNNVQVYDTDTNSWSQATPKPGTAVAGLRGAIVDGQLVVTGGYSQVAGMPMSATWIGTIDPTDPTTIAWTAGPDYPAGPVGRLSAGVPVSDVPGSTLSSLNAVVFTGGDPSGGGTQPLADTWLFEIATETWFSLPAKPSAPSNISNFVPVTLDNRLHMVSTGGYDGSQFLAVNEWLTLMPGDSLFSDRFEPQ